MKLTKEQLEHRDTLVFGEPINWDVNKSGGIKRFENLSAENLEKLVVKLLVNPFDRQNDSPSITEFRHFMNKYENVMAHGYVVSPHRADTRLSIEGIEYDGPMNLKMVFDLVSLCRHADDFELNENGFFVWFD